MYTSAVPVRSCPVGAQSSPEPLIRPNSHTQRRLPFIDVTSDHMYYKVDVLSLESLKDTLVSYLERKDLDAPPDVEELFPEEICLSQYVEAWKFIVAFKQERGQRQ